MARIMSVKERALAVVEAGELRQALEKMGWLAPKVLDAIVDAAVASLSDDVAAQRKKQKPMERDPYHCPNGDTHEASNVGERIICVRCGETLG